MGAITATRLGNVRGKVELALLTTEPDAFPGGYATRWEKASFIAWASDLDQPALKSWADRRLVWDKLLASFWAREQRNDSASQDRNVSGSNFLGYDDLVGQLRATLDYFPRLACSALVRSRPIWLDC